MADPAALSIFSCGKPRLDDFLTSQALALHEAKPGLTNVVFHQQLFRYAIIIFISTRKRLTHDETTMSCEIEVAGRLSAADVVRVAAEALIHPAGPGKANHPTCFTPKRA